jgi:hypothetical protein
MTKKIFYEKIGRKYVPVREYDDELTRSFPHGNHLVMCYPGGKTTRHNIEPEYAPMIAAGRICEDVISKAIMKAHEIRPYQNVALTPEQKVAWDNLVAVLGDGGRYLEWPSAREVTDAAVKALAEEAVKMLENESVKLAYDQFIIVATLAKERQTD